MNKQIMKQTMLSLEARDLESATVQAHIGRCGWIARLIFKRFKMDAVA